MQDKFPKPVSKFQQCSNEAGSGAKNQEQEQAGSGAEASAGAQKLLLSLLLVAPVENRAPVQPGSSVYAAAPV